MKNRFIVIPILALLLLLGCQPAATTEQSNSPAFNETTTAIVSTATPVNFKEQTFTATPTLGALEYLTYLDAIPSGQYLLIRKFIKGKPHLLIVHPNKTVIHEAPEEEYILGTSNDGAYLLIRENTNKFRILDLENKTWTNISIDVACSEPSWSQDGSQIIFACFNGNIDLYKWDAQSDSLTKITNCEENDLYCNAPSWSANSKWLTYLRAEIKSGPPSPENGIYIFNASCMEENRCMEDQSGFIDADSNPTWLGENHLLAAKNNIISIYSIEEGKLKLEKEIQTDIPNIRRVEISPDQKFLVYSAISTNNLVFITRPLDQSAHHEVLLEEAGIIGWITIP